ncbi:hypothetical protein GMB86_00735 [Terrilactibacillus sp. BCM23-1]|uniref:Uncharacterized protein n=1 Tax=Terrilactibacillus tamarindi TaxID=2599694 RepID=A0A6N8CL30_9BACI|nr:hypothetical protein [Terrilactibacillus tamarindi]MTT30539.1 hypothetical protein [Terrilactibacillus tamarindi]
MKNLNYEIDHSMIDLEESQNKDDIEFLIHLKTEESIKRMRNIREFYESDKVYTDIYFYPHANHQYKVIVKYEGYVPFLVKMFQFKLLKSVSWK